MPINCVYYNDNVRVHRNGDVESRRKLHATPINNNKWRKIKNHVCIDGDTINKKHIYNFCYNHKFGLANNAMRNMNWRFYEHNHIKY